MVIEQGAGPCIQDMTSVDSRKEVKGGRERDVLSLFQALRGSIMLDEELLRCLLLHAEQSAHRVRSGLPLVTAVSDLADELERAFCGRLPVTSEVESGRRRLAWRALAGWSLSVELGEDR